MADYRYCNPESIGTVITSGSNDPEVRGRYAGRTLSIRETELKDNWNILVRFRCEAREPSSDVLAGTIEAHVSMGDMGCSGADSAADASESINIWLPRIPEELKN